MTPWIMSAQNSMPITDPNVPPVVVPNNSSTTPPPPSQTANQSQMSTPSYGLTDQPSPFAPFPQVEAETAKESVLVPNSDNIQSTNAPSPGNAMTVSPDNSTKKFSLFILILALIVGLILAGVVFLYFSNKQLSQSQARLLFTSALV